MPNDCGTIILRSLNSFFCWGALPKIKTSLSTRFAYMALLLHQMIFMMVARFGGFPIKCKKPFLLNRFCQRDHNSLTSRLAGSWSFLVFLGLSLFHIAVGRSRSWRASTHYGFWALKIVIFLLPCYEMPLDLKSVIYTPYHYFLVDEFVAFSCLVTMTVLEFSATWGVAVIIIRIIRKRFADRPRTAKLILFAVSGVMFFVAILLGIFGPHFFKQNKTSFWVNWTISIVIGAICSIICGYQNKNQVVLGGIFALRMVFSIISAMFHRADEAYEEYSSLPGFYYFFHVMEMISSVFAFTYYVFYGLRREPVNPDHFAMITEETTSQFCCCSQRKQVYVNVPPIWENEPNPPTQYQTTDFYNDEYTKTRYHWELFYLLSGVFILHFSAGITDWYHIPDDEDYHAEYNVYNYSMLMYAKLIGAWMCSFVLLYYLIRKSGETLPE